MKKQAPIITIALSIGWLLSQTSLAHAQDYRDVVKTEQGKIIHNTFRNCVRTDWSSNSDACGHLTQTAQAQTERQYAIPAEQRTIYFKFDKARIQPSERRKLDSLAETLKSNDDISGVRIMGYADRIGSMKNNDVLSRKRAMAVEKALRDRGYLNTTIAETRWFGEEDSVTQCSKNLKRADLINCLHNDRRVTLEITY